MNWWFRGSGPRSNRKTRGRLETRMPAIRMHTHAQNDHPMQILQENIPNPNKSTQIPLFATPGVCCPHKMSYTFVVMGESPAASAIRHLKSGREDKALLSIPATKTSPFDSDWPNMSLAVQTPTTEMQLPEVDQGQLNPDLTAWREKLPQQLRVFVLPQPQAAKHISVSHDHFHTHSDDCDPAPHINYHKRGGRSAHCSR